MNLHKSGVRSNDKMRSYRERLRTQGLRPVQIWVPDCRSPKFRASLKRQVARLNPADEMESLAFIGAVTESFFDEQ